MPDPSEFRVPSDALCELHHGPYDGLSLCLPKPVPQTIVFRLPSGSVEYVNDHPIDEPDICTHHSYHWLK